MFVVGKSLLYWTLPQTNRHIDLAFFFGWYNKIFKLRCFAMPLKSTSLVDLRSFFSTCYHRSIHTLDLRWSHSFFWHIICFNMGMSFAYGKKETSRRKDYHQRYRQHKYNAFFSAHPVVDHNPLMVRLMPPILFENAQKLPCLHNYLNCSFGE